MTVTLSSAIICGFQEIITRSLTEWKEVKVRKILGRPELKEGS